MVVVIEVTQTRKADMSDAPPITFDSTWHLVESWQGWLRRAQGLLLWKCAARVPPGGTLVEIGSYQGKSTAVLGRAVAGGVTVVAIDPHAGNDRGPGEWTGAAADGESDHQAFARHLVEAGVDGRVRHVRQFSQQAHDAVDGDIDLLYVDGAHGYRPASDDLTSWGDRVRHGGELLVHDVYNSVFVTLAIWRHVLVSPDWCYLGRQRSMAHFRREPRSARQRVWQVARTLTDLPFFARNLLLKGLRALHAERLGVLLGHRSGSGMY